MTDEIIINPDDLLPEQPDHIVIDFEDLEDPLPGVVASEVITVDMEDLPPLVPEYIPPPPPPEEGPSCPFCGQKILPNENAGTCIYCGIPHHEECWRSAKGCTTLGCIGYQNISAFKKEIVSL